MSDLLNKASLVVIPSGYKEDTVYSVVPSDGSGDLSFTRASNGTRINSAGLVEVCPWNLFTQSIWSGGGALPTGWSYSFSTGSSTPTTSIYGLGSAYSFSTSGTRQVFNQSFNYISGNIYSLSIRVESVSGTIAVQDIIFFNGGGTLTYFEDGASVSASKAVVAGKTYTTVIACNATATQQVRVGSGCTASTTGTVVLSQPQLIDGSTAKPYFPTTDRLNVPRLTYQNGGGGCPSLLLEPQRTNIALRSEEFNNASSWALTNSGTITANSTISPDGTQTADTLNAGANSAQVQQAPTGTSGAVYTVSIWVKRITGTGNVFLRAVENADTLIAVTSDWQRFTATVTSTTTTIRVGVKLATSGDAVAIWGAQIELGAYPTSYIPTTTASATRVVDAFSRNNIYTNGLITSSGGTWFVELRNNVAVIADNAPSGFWLGTSSGTATSDGTIYFRQGGGTQRTNVWKYVSGTATQLYQTTTDTTKIAIKWNGTTADIFENGTKVVSGTAFTATNMEFLTTSGVGRPFFIQNMALFNSALTDTQCQTLTT
jgi:hypothetical protein